MRRALVIAAVVAACSPPPAGNDGGTSGGGTAGGSAAGGSAGGSSGGLAGGSAGGAAGGSTVPFAGCPPGTIKIDGQWGNSAILTSDFGAWTDNIISVRVAVPPGNYSMSTALSSWSEYIAGSCHREASFSTVACDFSAANALKNGLGQPLVSSDQITVTFRYRIGAPDRFAAGLTVGGVYYINMRNRFIDGTVSCTLPDCTMRGGLPSP